MTRYGVIAAFAAAMAACALVGACSSTTSSATAASSNQDHTDLVYVGTQEREIQALRFDPATGKLTMIGQVAQGLKATWVAAHPELPVLYSVDDDNAREGSVTAFAVNRNNGALTRIDEVATQGSGTTNLYLDIPSMTLLAANYGGGSVSTITVNHDGSLGARGSTVKEIGSGPNRRQAGAHAHSAVVDPSGRYALVPDLGADRVFVYPFDRVTHALSPDDAAVSHAFVAPPGSGPRHLAFGADGQFVYLLTELSADVMVLRWDASQGRLTTVQTVSITSPGFQGVKSGAEIALSRDGRFAYVENRAENALLVYRVSPDSGRLALVQRVPSGGEKPWGFAIHPSGKWLLVANQRSGKVNVFSVDPVSGEAADTGQSVEMATPVSLAFVR